MGGVQPLRKAALWLNWGCPGSHTPFVATQTKNISGPWKATSVLKKMSWLIGGCLARVVYKGSTESKLTSPMPSKIQMAPPSSRNFNSIKMQQGTQVSSFTRYSPHFRNRPRSAGKSANYYSAPCVRESGVTFAGLRTSESSDWPAHPPAVGPWRLQANNRKAMVRCAVIWPWGRIHGSLLRWMNIHLPPILTFTRGTVLTHSQTPQPPVQ